MPPTQPTTPQSASVTQPPVPDQTHVITSLVPQASSDLPKPKSKFKVFLSVLISLLVLLLVAASALAYSVAYNKIKLAKNPDLQDKISYLVQNLPFMPKTPKYVFAKAALAQEKITKESFDISLAIDSADLSKILGLSSIDLSAKGKIDFGKANDPKITLDLFITKDFNVELTKSDPVLYFKINKLPNLLLSFLGLKAEQFEPLTNKWVALDTTPLETEARKNLQDQEVEPFSQDYLNDNLQNFFDAKILDAMRMEKTEIEGVAVYKLTLNATPEIIDYLGKKLDDEAKKTSGAFLDKEVASSQKLSDMLKRLTWEFDIDQKNYYIRKVVISTDLEVDQSDYGNLLLGTTSSTKSRVSIAFAIKLDDFGKEVVIEKPESSMSFEEFTDSLSEIIKEIYAGFLTQTQSSDLYNSEMPEIPPMSELP